MRLEYKHSCNTICCIAIELPPCVQEEENVNFVTAHTPDETIQRKRAQNLGYCSPV